MCMEFYFEMIIQISYCFFPFASSVSVCPSLTSLTSVVSPPLSHRVFTLSPHIAALH